MRKLALFAALVGSLGGAAVMHAQAPQTPQDTAHRAYQGRGGRQGRGGPAMMDRMLLKNITLTYAEKGQLAQLRKSERAKMAADSGARRADFEAMRKARQSGDSATMKKLMAEQRTRMVARLDENAAAIRTVLTPDQRKQLDANVAELKSHPAELGRGRAPGQWHAQRSPAN